MLDAGHSTFLVPCYTGQGREDYPPSHERLMVQGPFIRNLSRIPIYVHCLPSNTTFAYCSVTLVPVSRQAYFLNSLAMFHRVF